MSVNYNRIRYFLLGLNFSDITLPDQQTPAGQASMTGSLFWYNDTSILPGWYPSKFYLAFAEFDRRYSFSSLVVKLVTFNNFPETTLQ